jgi:peptidoglycan/xylan/chitin deacetylase (PgdA/CDA1 family)
MDAVLVYHSVGGRLGSGYKWDLPTSQFRRAIRRLNARYEIVDLEEMIFTPERSQKRIAITFDDAFQNVYEHAIPLLRELKLPATVFVSSEFIGDNRVNCLRDRHNLPDSTEGIVMTESQLQELADDDLFTLGNHSATHPDLTTITDDDELGDEITSAKFAMEETFGVDVDRFAYPYGEFDDRVAEVVADSHKLAVTSVPSLVNENTKPHRIPRLDGCQPASVISFEVSDISSRLRNFVRDFNQTSRSS